MAGITCSICLDDLKSPMSIPCGHLHCEKCLMEYIESGEDAMEALCPECRAPFSLATPDLRYVPPKYHAYIVPSIRRVYIPSSATAVQLNAQNASLTTKLAAAEKLARSLQRDKERLIDRCESAIAKSDAIAKAERQFRVKCETLEKEAREMKCETLRLRERERYVKGESEEARFREQEMKVENEKLKKEVGELKKKYGEMKGKYKALMQESPTLSSPLSPSAPRTSRTQAPKRTSSQAFASPRRIHNPSNPADQDPSARLMAPIPKRPRLTTRIWQPTVVPDINQDSIKAEEEEDDGGSDSDPEIRYFGKPISLRESIGISTTRPNEPHHKSGPSTRSAVAFRPLLSGEGSTTMPGHKGKERVWVEHNTSSPDLQFPEVTAARTRKRVMVPLLSAGHQSPQPSTSRKLLPPQASASRSTLQPNNISLVPRAKAKGVARQRPSRSAHPPSNSDVFSSARAEPSQSRGLVSIGPSRLLTDLSWSDTEVSTTGEDEDSFMTAMEQSQQQQLSRANSHLDHPPSRSALRQREEDEFRFLRFHDMCDCGPVGFVRAAWEESGRNEKKANRLLNDPTWRFKGEEPVLPRATAGMLGLETPSGSTREKGKGRARDDGDDRSGDRSDGKRKRPAVYKGRIVSSDGMDED